MDLNAEGNMLRRILVPLDGSRFAEVAVPVAVRLARLAGAELRFVLVHEPELATVPAPDGGFGLVPSDPARKELETAYLSELVARLEAGPDLQVGTCLLDGSAGEALAEKIGWWAPDLVVMATHGRGPFRRFWLGGVADHLMRHVSAPLLLLRPKDEVDWSTDDLQPKSILVPWDLSRLSEAILGSVSELAALHGAKVKLVYVIEPHPGVAVSAYPYATPVLPELIPREREDAERELSRVAARLREHGLVVETAVIVGASVATGLLDELDQGGHDLVALATHGASGLERALVGSVADRLIRGANKPVLVVRPSVMA